MKIQVKNIKGEIVQVEAEPEELVLQLKGKIQAKMSVESENQKLIYKGKHLENNNSLKEYGIQDGDTIIVMMLKKFTAQDPSLAEPPKTEPAKPTTTAQPAPKPTAPANPAQPANPPAQGGAPLFNPNVAPPQPHPQLDPNNEIVYGSSHKAEILKELQEMGFTAAESEKALAAAFFNKDRAVDYLLNGIPANLQHHAQQPAQGHPPAQPANPGQQAQPAQPAQPGQPAQIPITQQQMEQIQQLIVSPEFENIRQQFLQNPQIIEQLMNFLQQNRPELHQLFSQYPQLLIAILTNQLNPGDGGEEDDLAEEGVELTPQDQQAITEMQSLGFTQQQCTEAYLICDKNKDLAINFLLDQQGNIPANPGSGSNAPKKQ